MDEVEQDPQEITFEEETRGRNNKTRLGILLLVVGLALGYMVYAAFPGNALYFMTVTEFMSREEVQDGRIVRVSGKLVDGSFQRVSNSTLSNFQLIDKDSEATVVNLSASYEGVVPDLFFNPHSEIILQLIDKDSEATVVNLSASYEGVVPDLFFNPHSEIILQGSYGPDRVFETDTILVKCPSKYQSLEDELRASS